jgi:sodium/bile acid cotransporter 7
MSHAACELEGANRQRRDNCRIRPDHGCPARFATAPAVRELPNVLCRARQLAGSLGALVGGFAAAHRCLPRRTGKHGRRVLYQRQCDQNGSQQIAYEEPAQSKQSGQGVVRPGAHVASLLPCYGAGARVFDSLALLAIGSLFFLQGARLSRDAIVAGMKNWRLHLGIASTTFILFPLLGLGLFRLSPGILTPPLQIGVLFVCALPSTVQSSIALTSIARGNVAGVICAATASNIIGAILTPMLLTLMLRVQGAAIDLNGLWKILVELILPFIVGHLLRPWIGQWADQNRGILAVTDRSSVLLVVYTAFSAAVVDGVWSRTPPITLAALVLIDALLLIAVLVAIKLASRLFALPRTDEVAMIFCGSQKSAITGVPMAHLLFSGLAAGMIVLPIIIYHQLQLWLGAWLARRYASAVIVDYFVERSRTIR